MKWEAILAGINDDGTDQWIIMSQRDDSEYQDEDGWSLTFKSKEEAERFINEELV
jgi:hypothetical protein